MSARGIEIHNGYARLPQVTEIAVGTPSVPIDQTVANSIEIGVVKSIKVATGSETGIEAILQSAIAGAQNLRGIRSKVSALTALALTGYMYGVYVELEVLGTATMSGLYEGIRIEQYVESGTTFSSATVYPIHVANSISKQPSSYAFFRLSEDGASYVDDIFLITKGALCTDMKYLFDIVYGAAIGMLATVGACTGTAGYLKIKCNSDDRYIQLYSTPP